MTDVSVVMAVHNGRRYLADQIRSVMLQLAPGDEIVIVDDASTDDSYAWLQDLRDPRIRLCRCEQNMGVLGSFERALSLARHDYVFLCDQDDIWLPGKRERFLQAFENDRHPLVVISDAQMIDADGEMFEPSFMRTRGGFKPDFWSNVIRNRFLGCSMALHRRVLEVALPIPAYVPMHDMWLGLIGSLLGNVEYIERPFLQYRRHGGNVSPSKRQGWRRVALWRLQLLRAITCRLPRVALQRNTALTP